MTPNSAFDCYLRGDKGALTVEEQEGYTLFQSMGCVACHNGVLLGGNMYQKFGVMKEYTGDLENLGRFNVTGNEADKYVFKVPSLRNVALTAPYFHDASKKALIGAIKIMAEYQLGRLINEKDAIKIELFLNTLTGETPEILKDP